jgi:LEA14-like dessication related protein
MKKALVALAILSSVTSVIVYSQYKKLTKYILKYNGFKVNNFNSETLNFSLFFTITNQSDIDIVILNQNYKVYLNNVFFIESDNPTAKTINKNSASSIKLDVFFAPKIIDKKIISSIGTSGNVNIKVEYFLKVKLLFTSFKIPGTYTTTLTDLISHTQ